MSVRTVFDTILDGAGAPIALEPVTLYRRAGTFTAAASLPPAEVTVLTDVDGFWTANLTPNTEGVVPNTWLAVYPNGDGFEFVLFPGLPISVSELRLAGLIVTWSPADLQLAMEAYRLTWDASISAEASIRAAADTAQVAAIADINDAANSIPHADSLTLDEGFVHTAAHVRNIQAFGASPGASMTINSTAIQAAINDLPATGGVIQIPAGTYAINKQNLGIMFSHSPKSYVAFIGQGMGNTTLLLDTDDTTTYDGVIFDVTGLQHVTFAELTLDMNRGDGANTGRYEQDTTSSTTLGRTYRGIHAAYSSHLTLFHVRLQNSLGEGAVFMNCGDIAVDHCELENIRNNGLEFNFPIIGGGYPGSQPSPQAPTPAFRNLSVTNCTFKDINDTGSYYWNVSAPALITGGIAQGTGIALASTQPNAVIYNVDFSHNSFIGCKRDTQQECHGGSGGSGGAIVRNMRISHNHSEACLYGSIAVTPAHLFDVTHNIIHNCGDQTAIQDANAITYGITISGSGEPGVSADGTFSYLVNCLDNVILDDRGSATNYTRRMISLTNNHTVKVSGNILRPSSANGTGIYVGTQRAHLLIGQNIMESSGSTAKAVELVGPFVFNPSIGRNLIYGFAAGLVNTAAVSLDYDGYYTESGAHFIGETSHDGHIKFSAPGKGLFPTTLAGADTSFIPIQGGGGLGDLRGAGGWFYGNQHATSPGLLDLRTGNVAGAAYALWGAATKLVDWNAVAGWIFRVVIGFDDDLVVNTVAKGMRSNTSVSADSKSVHLSGGGAHSDARGATIAAYGAQAGGGLGGWLDLRSSTAGKTRIQGGGQASLLVDANGIAFQRGTTLNRTPVNDANYTALVTNHVIAYTALTASRTVALPAAATAGSGKEFVIIDEAGGATAFPIVIDPSGAELINGAATVSISANFGSLRLICSGTAWIAK